jgi:NADPH-dependent glutamate synthase beta subunit-like oxidoreductase
MGLLWIEAKCSQYGFERYKIKVIKKFNIPSGEITPRFRSRPIPGELSCLLVGRDVNTQEIERFVTDYFRQRGLWGSILTMRLEF